MLAVFYAGNFQRKLNQFLIDYYLPNERPELKEDASSLMEASELNLAL